MNKKIILKYIVFFTLCIIVILYIFKDSIFKEKINQISEIKDVESNPTVYTKNLDRNNEIVLEDRAKLSLAEQEQIKKDINQYMNEFILPADEKSYKYKLTIEQRIGDAIKVIIDDEPYQKTENYEVAYLRKIDNVWVRDKSAGPWCTLEEFEQYECN